MNDYNTMSLWLLGDEDDYGDFKGHYIIVTPDSEDELPGRHTFATEDAAKAYCKEHAIRLVPLVTE